MIILNLGNHGQSIHALLSEKMSEVSLNHFDYPGHLAQRFKELLSDEAFADVTLVRVQSYSFGH